MQTKRWRNLFFWITRLSVFLSIFLNSISAIIEIFSDKIVEKGEIFLKFSERGEIFLGAFIFLILSIIPDYIEMKNKVDIPDILEIIVIIFIYASTYMSVRFNLYYNFFWWDDLLHTFSGIIIGFLGFIFVFKLNENYSLNLNPFLVALFAFCFSVTMGVLWEIFEFTTDALIKTTHQKWDLPPESILLGKPYQGSGLRDTMSDLILDSIGALFSSMVGYVMYKARKMEVIKYIKNSFKRFEEEK
ncbi:MAG: hypothetical protein N2258_06675 [Brevinematales bacterium]|nr:hypothetical protein [Brevinematales bacterium]